MIKPVPKSRHDQPTIQIVFYVKTVKVQERKPEFRIETESKREYNGIPI